MIYLNTWDEVPSKLRIQVQILRNKGDSVNE